MATTPVQAFRHSMIPFARLVGVVLLAVCLFEASQVRTFRGDWRTLGAGIGLIGLVGFGVLAGIGASWRVYVSPTTLRGFDFFGRYHDVRWPDIQSAIRVSYFGLPYLKVEVSRLRPEVWIPLYLVRMPDFTRLVAEYAGPENPLTRALALAPNKRLEPSRRMIKE